MQATIGDRICIHGSIVGHPDKNGEIVEVHGDGGTPPYLVKFDDGKTRLIYPGPDAVIEHPGSLPSGDTTLHPNGAAGAGNTSAAVASPVPRRCGGARIRCHNCHGTRDWVTLDPLSGVF
jgi:hypothetical protein